jgi:large subunit ribosomal protein L19
MATSVKISPVDIESRKKLNIKAGDNLRVWQKIKEGDKTRLQAFEGLVLSVKHGTEAGATFTVRKVIDGVGVERTFPLYSPSIDSVEFVRRSKVRRAKLYFIREKASKEIKRQMSKVRASKEPSETIVAEAPKAEAKK